MALNAFHIHGIIVGVLTLLVSLALMLFQGEMLVLLVTNKSDGKKCEILKVNSLVKSICETRMFHLRVFERKKINV